MDNEKKDVWSFKTADLFTVPNLLTYCRFILIAPFIYFFLAEKYIEAALVIAASGLTDCFDGFFARRLGQITPLGKLLDPIADKLTLVAVALCMVIYVPSVIPVLIILVLKDLLMLAGGMNLIKKGLTPPAAKWYGKAGTVMFYFSVVLIVFFKAIFNFESFIIDCSLLSLTAAAMLFALYKYGMIYLKMLAEYNSAKKTVKK